MTPLSAPLRFRSSDRPKSPLGKSWSRWRGAASIVLAALGGCTAADDEVCGDGTDCSNVPMPWISYDVRSLTDPSRTVGLTVEVGGEYEMSLKREGGPIEEPGCEASEEGCTGIGSSTLCLSGELDSDQIAAADAVLRSDLADAYALDDLTMTPDEMEDRTIHFVPPGEEGESQHFKLASGGALQPETALLITTLDGLALELYARAEYCTEADRALAENGEWVFPISE